jgi:hypothetical protein
MDLRRSASDVQRFDDGVAFQKFEDSVAAASIQSLGPFRSGFDVAVMAGKVAA